VLDVVEVAQMLKRHLENSISTHDDSRRKLEGTLDTIMPNWRLVTLGPQYFFFWRHYLASGLLRRRWTTEAGRLVRLTASTGRPGSVLALCHSRARVLPITRPGSRIGRALRPARRLPFTTAGTPHAPSTLGLRMQVAASRAQAV
jgi:hypothetical protein